jgi:multidrug efflux pump subunit AcrB
MNISRFFIERPVFAAMLSAIILLAGLLALPHLPISEYPEVVPPTVVVHASYPGASPSTIAETVASPLEQAITGVEDMLYQYSQATSDGAMTLTITFKLGTDVDKAQVQVQNRVAQALPKLPQEVQRLGVTTNKASPDITLAVFVYSPDGRYDQTYLATSWRCASRTSCRDWTASATYSDSAAATIRCASGSIPRRSPPAT